MAHRFRFGVQARFPGSLERWRRLARRAEDLGYATLTMHEHLDGDPAPLPALAVAGAVTRELRVGSLVLLGELRNPVLLAKEIATVDVLTGGRFEWGMGAGWVPQDYERAGVPMADGGTRLRRLAEAVAIMKGCLAGAPYRQEGDHWSAVAPPEHLRPTQEPHPPLLIGGQGPRLLELAGREADIVGVAPSLRSRRILGAQPRATVEEALAAQLASVRRGAGERLGDLELNAVAFPTLVTTDPRDRLERAAEVAGHLGMVPGDLHRSPHVLVGTVEQLQEAIEAHRSRWGISYWVVPAGALEAFAPVVEALAGR